ncbi:Camk/cdpk protein kinase [Globisporangium polare]
MKKKKRKASAAVAARKATGDAGSAQELPSQEPADPLTQASRTESNGSSSQAEGSVVKNERGHGGDATAQLSSPNPQQLSELPSATGSVNSDVPDVLFTPQEATKILERFFTVLLMASIPAHLALKPFCGQQLPIDKIEDVLQQSGLPNDLVPIELKAFRSLATTTSTSCSPNSTVGGQLLFDQASAIAFRTEMCELQVRAAVLELAAGSKTAKAKVDFQRIVGKLTSHLSSANSQISSVDFERLLEEKLGLTPGAFLVKVVFARITGRPFQRSFPKVLEAVKAQFCEAFERFCVNKPLSGDSVEGQLRQLVIKFPDMRAAFQQMDLDGSGAISTPEFVAFLQSEGNMCFPESVLTAFIKRFDVDGDGTLNYDEFVEFVRPKQFGVNVLSPFGMFYLVVDRLEKMRDVVEKIKTRLFWLQHNDLFAVASAAASAVAAATTRANGAGAAQVPTAKLKVTDRFVLTHHFGARRLVFEPKDPIVSVVANGELVVLILTKDDEQQQLSSTLTNGRSLYAGRDAAPPLPPFEYRLKPTTKRNLPPLFSTTEMTRAAASKEQTTTAQQRTAASSSHMSTRAPTRTTIRKLSATKRKPSVVPASKSRSSSSAFDSDDDRMRLGAETARRQRPLEEEGGPWDDTMSSISSGTHSAVSLSPSEAEKLWRQQQQQQQQRFRMDLSTESIAHTPQPYSPTVVLKPSHPVSPTAPQSQDSDSDAFELFEDDGDEALPVSSDLDYAVLPLCNKEMARHHVEADSDDESPPPPYE